MSPGVRRQGEDRVRPVDLVDTVRAAVQLHPAADRRETLARTRILECLDSLPRPFDEQADLIHLTGSAVVVGRRGTVLHRHKRLHRWMQPGGHIDPGEAPWDAALRESEEETGLGLGHPDTGWRLIHVDVHDAAKGHTHLDLRFLLLAPDEDPAPPPDESPEVRWYSWDAALAVADAALVGALEVARRQPESDASDGCADGSPDAGHDPGADEGREDR